MMTGAALDTRRRELGLSIGETAGLLGVNERTLNRWVHGDYRIPADAPERLDQLDARMTKLVEETIAIATRERGADVELYRLRRPEAAPERSMDVMPAGAYAMAIAWAARAIRAKGINVNISWAPWEDAA